MLKITPFTFNHIPTVIQRRIQLARICIDTTNVCQTAPTGHSTYK
jgi:hypothetical protein